MGWDVSGVVESAAVGVNRFAPGDEVFGMPWFPRETADAEHVITRPGTPLAGRSAYATSRPRACRWRA